MPVGFNWPNAGRVYVAHWDQQSVKAADPSKPFRVAKANNVRVMRVVLGDDVVINRWKANPEGALTDTKRMLDDAQANGIKLNIHNRLTQEAVSELSGNQYGSWGDARRDVTTPNSAAWNGLANWMQAVVPRFAAHPALYSWEVTNEPGWMLGIDDGSVSRAQGFSFIDSFQARLKSLGATRVNMGGRVFHTPSQLTDDEIHQLTANLDVLDDHMYSDSTPNAVAGMDAHKAYTTRAKALANHPLDVMVGEFGTTPYDWFKTVLDYGVANNWLVLPWGYDAYDLNIFNEVGQKPEILAYLKSAATAGSGLLIYGNELSSGWQNWSWSSTVSFSNMAPVFDGLRSIAYTPNAAWAGLKLHSDTAVDVTPYTAVQFAAQATQNNEKFTLWLEDVNGVITGSVPLTTYGDPVAGSWKVYTITLTALNASCKQIRDIVLQSSSDQIQHTLYIDQVKIA